METCKEFFLDDIVKVQVYRTLNCVSAIPYGAYIYEAEVSLGTPVIELDISPVAQQGVAVGSLTQSPTLKVTDKAVKAGIIYQHDLQAQIDSGIHDVIRAINKVNGFDVHYIYITAQGDMYLTQALPNTASLSFEYNAGSNRILTVKLSAKSSSSLIIATKKATENTDTENT